HVRETNTLVAHCAWCGRLRLGEGWVDVEEVPQFLIVQMQLGDRRTHGICPECFDEAQRLAGKAHPRSTSCVVIRAGGPLALECLSRALSGYPVTERPDFVLEAILPDAGGGALRTLLSLVARCLEENALAPVTLELGDRAYVLG